MNRIPIIVGLGFGDEGKGTTVDYLTSKLDDPANSFVVRFSGGPQTAHNVITDDGRHHTFSQFGAGTFHGAGTIATEHMLINPFNMVLEAQSLMEKIGANPFSRTAIDGNALLITPIHREANRQREINRGKDRHGSCGEGVGETRSFSLQFPSEALRMADMASRATMESKMEFLIRFYEREIPGFSFGGTAGLVGSYTQAQDDIFQHVVKDGLEILDIIAHFKDSLVFEGSQGVLLDEVHGFHPNTTWSDTTNAKALKVLSEAGIHKDRTHTLGILRTYATRHGDGPFPTLFTNEADTLDYPEAHNGFGQWQGDFRIGAFDMELSRYANKATGLVDGVSLTHCDRMPKSVLVSYATGMPEPQRIAPDGSFDREERQRISDHVRSLSDTDFLWENDVCLDGFKEMIQSNVAPIDIESHGPKTSQKKG